MAGWIVTVPKNLKESDRERFFQVTYEFLIERYGERNCIQAIVHNDEGGQPHMHFLFIPATSDQKHGGEKICANDVLNKTELRNFHPALQKWLIDHDVQANILTGITKAQGGNRTVQELKNGKTRSRWRTEEYESRMERGSRWR